MFFSFFAFFLKKTFLFLGYGIDVLVHQWAMGKLPDCNGVRGGGSYLGYVSFSGSFLPSMYKWYGFYMVA